MSHESHREWQLLTEGNPNGTHGNPCEPTRTPMAGKDMVMQKAQLELNSKGV